MNCLRCGKTTQTDQVFCDACLGFMEKHPVKPDTAIHLPHRNEPVAPKKQSHRKKPASPEEQVLQLKKLCRRLTVTLVIVLALLGLCAGALFYHLTQPQNAPIQGRNYTIDTTQN